MCVDAVFLVPDDVPVCGDCFRVRVYAVVAVGKFACTLAALVPFLRRSLVIGCLELGRGVVLFAYGEKLLALLHVVFGATRDKKQRH